MICCERNSVFFFWDGTGGGFYNSFNDTYLQLRQGMERLSTGQPTVGVGKFPRFRLGGSDFHLSTRVVFLLTVGKFLVV